MGRPYSVDLHLPFFLPPLLLYFISLSLSLSLSLIHLASVTVTLFGELERERRSEEEMANQGAKKRKEENTRHMTKLLRIIIICNVIYVLVRMIIFHSSITWKHFVGLIVTSVAYVVPYKQLASMAKPSYADDGELLDGGFDMGTGGVCGYLHDVIYITCFVQLMSILSGKFWYTYLLIPAFGLYQISGLLKGFLSNGSEGDVEDEKSRKKREKMEKKASKTKFVKGRK
ncbi:hypothetical protein AQUCO_00700919v1 [Aquilegia coerulea]|uniref:Transmembrane protein 208 n=2 Tax=Aquilegia coerulea TaxID=218851 RepID=A0A2G5EMA2_AQUCA|nr:hypothetical protein AQUCO_00700919v1 [Aquilegia coerulea]